MAPQEDGDAQADGGQGAQGAPRMTAEISNRCTEAIRDYWSAALPCIRAGVGVNITTAVK